MTQDTRIISAAWQNISQMLSRAVAAELHCTELVRRPGSNHTQRELPPSQAPGNLAQAGRACALELR